MFNVIIKNFLVDVTLMWKGKGFQLEGKCPVWRGRRERWARNSRFQEEEPRDLRGSKEGKRRGKMHVWVYNTSTISQETSRRSCDTISPKTANLTGWNGGPESTSRPRSLWAELLSATTCSASSCSCAASWLNRNCPVGEPEKCGGGDILPLRGKQQRKRGRELERWMVHIS